MAVWATSGSFVTRQPGADWKYPFVAGRIKCFGIESDSSCGVVCTTSAMEAAQTLAVGGLESLDFYWFGTIADTIYGWYFLVP